MPQVSIWVRLAVYGICVLGIVLGMSHIYNMGYNARGEEDNAKILEANAKYDAAEKAKQEKSDAKAAAEKQVSDARFDTIMMRLGQIKSGTTPNRPTTKLPTDCVYDEARIKYGNED